MTDASTIENDWALRLRESQLKDEEDKARRKAVSSGSKVNIIELGLMLGFTFINAVLDYLIIGSIPVLGDIIDGITWFVIFVWVMSRGFKKPHLLMWSGAIELIPGGDILPLYTIIVLVIYFYNNHPKILRFLTLGTLGKS